MLKYDQIINEERILIYKQTVSKQGLLANMCRSFETCPNVHEPRSVLKDILAREEIMSTGIGGGIAIPHIRRDYISGVNVALGILRQPVEYDAMDGRKVDIVIMILAGAGCHHDHLRCVAKFAGFFKKSQNRNKVTAANSSSEVLALLRAADQ